MRVVVPVLRAQVRRARKPARDAVLMAAVALEERALYWRDAARGQPEEHRASMTARADALESVALWLADSR